MKWSNPYKPIQSPYREALTAWLRPAYHSVPTSEEALEKQYSSGFWDFLRASNELAHYSVLAGYADALHSGGELLDVGCGEGLLQARLARAGYGRYLGIDLSETAIKTASARTDARTTFAVADAANFTTDARFDAILFNEALYYFDDPRSLLRHYAGLLNPGGHFIVSMYVCATTLACWRLVELAFPVHEAARVSNTTGSAWWVKVLKA